MYVPLTFALYHMQHSTLALSTINLTAAHNKLSAKQILKPLFLLQPACTLNLMLAVSYLRICSALGGRRNSALTFLINTLKMMLHSVFGFSLSIGGNFSVATMIIFLQGVDFAHTVVLAPQYRERRLLASVCLCFCPSALNNSWHSRKKFMKYDASGFF